MKRSANEVMTLATKAARGAGAPPGQAADFGRAALCHLIAGRDPTELDAALNELPKGPILSLPLALTHLLETSKEGSATGTIPCKDTQTLPLSYAESLPFAQTAKPTPNGLHLNINTTRPAPRKAIHRVQLPDALAARLTTLAARTYVPESEASRLSGAGAGLTDND